MCTGLRTAPAGSAGRRHTSRLLGSVSRHGGLDLGSLTTQARFLAKRGVNLVRYLDRLPACDPANINAVNASVIDNAQRIVAAANRQALHPN